MKVDFKHNKVKFQKGFTLIELLVVIAIIGLLSSIVLVSLKSARNKSIAAKRISDLKQIEIALQLYYDDNGVFPASSHTCGGDWSPTFKTALKPYLSPVPIDPKNDQAKCNSADGYNNYYHFANPINWTGGWGSLCPVGTTVLSSQGGGIKAIRNDCTPGWLGQSNMLIIR